MDVFKICQLLVSAALHLKKSPLPLSIIMFPPLRNCENSSVIYEDKFKQRETREVKICAHLNRNLIFILL